MMELKRWRAFNNVELNLEPEYFPAASETARLMTIACGEAGQDISRLSAAILRGVWVEERNIADEPTLIAIANEQEMDGASLLEAAKSEPIAAIAAANIAEALARNVFGAPTYIFQNENFWGQDRLDFVERALAAA
jgi:2-hydroxychromene-2-carboxylate isomerase